MLYCCTSIVLLIVSHQDLHQPTRMLSKIASGVALLVLVAFIVTEAAPRRSEAAVADQLRSMAASPIRNKRASFSVLPGRLRFEELNQRRWVQQELNFSGFEPSKQWLELVLIIPPIASLNLRFKPQLSLWRIS